MWSVQTKTISEIRAIEGADAIECAIIGDGWPCVVRKGDFAVGNTVVYYPADSLIPDNILQRMGLVGKLSGSLKNRVKAIKLRGQLSIGLVERYDNAIHGENSEGKDLAEQLGIIRWEEVVPECLRGIARSHPPYFLKYDVNSINDGNHYNPYDYVFVTEKLHGTASAFGYNRITGFSVSSRNITLERDEGNLYWKMALKYNIESLLKKYYEDCKYPDEVYVYLHGEIVGQGVQDLTYSLKEPELFIYDLRVNNRGWVPPPILDKIVAEWGLKTVPKIWQGMYEDGIHVRTLANGMSTIDNNTIREGVVLRNYDRTKVSKIVSEAYLLRKGGTELH